MTTTGVDSHRHTRHLQWDLMLVDTMADNKASTLPRTSSHRLLPTPTTKLVAQNIRQASTLPTTQQTTLLHPAQLLSQATMSTIHLVLKLTMPRTRPLLGTPAMTLVIMADQGLKM